MRLIIFVAFVFGIHKPSLSQGFNRNDTCDKNYKIEQGKLRRFNLLDNGTYLWVASDNYSIIEFAFLSWGTRYVKYRLEKTFGNQTYIITKTISNTDVRSAITYVAIDSVMYSKIGGNKKNASYLKKEKICEKLSDADLELFTSYSSFIKEHSLETEFSNFYPSLVVAWLKIKG